MIWKVVAVFELQVDGWGARRGHSLIGVARLVQFDSVYIQWRVILAQSLLHVDFGLLLDTIG